MQFLFQEGRLKHLGRCEPSCNTCPEPHYSQDFWCWARGTCPTVWNDLQLQNSWLFFLVDNKNLGYHAGSMIFAASSHFISLLINRVSSWL